MRVIQNCKTAYVNGKYISHHHHAHVCFNYQYDRFIIERRNKVYPSNYHCKHGNYKCPQYDGCEWNKDVYTIDYDKCVDKG